MSEKEVPKLGIKSLLRDQDIAYFSDPKEWTPAEREILELNKTMAEYHKRNSDLEAELSSAKSLQSKAGKANAEKYQRLHSLCIDTYAECCLDLMAQQELTSMFSSASLDQLEDLVRKIRPPFKVFGRSFHDKARVYDLTDYEVEWLTWEAAQVKTDSTLHKWWKEKNRELKTELKAFLETD